ncbi:hypothetical protein CDAR_248231 [Caerostris darwini]|uniref:Uncharacterized protein n=1 Tax=Caerostris darwini TaxID=1538125 RepID=A0AAV4VM76_9ARAC|nr:hypothetical protein CDAR_248231 [Caerostris darwini]
MSYIIRHMQCIQIATSSSKANRSSFQPVPWNWRVVEIRKVKSEWNVARNYSTNGIRLWTAGPIPLSPKCKWFAELGVGCDQQK